MSNLDVLHDAFKNGGALLRVWAVRFDGLTHFVTELKLDFEHLALVVTADGEFDTVVLKIGEPNGGSDTSLHEVTDDAPWKEAIGLRLQWGWELTNQQGYADGVRFEFGNADAAKSVQVELIAAASMLHAHRCCAVEWATTSE